MPLVTHADKVTDYVSFFALNIFRENDEGRIKNQRGKGVITISQEIASAVRHLASSYTLSHFGDIVSYYCIQ